MSNPSYRIFDASEHAVLIYFSDTISSEQTQKLAAFSHALKASLGELIVDVTISYTSALVTYQSLSIDHFSIKQKIKSILTQLNDIAFSVKQIELPAYYHNEVGADLNAMAKAKNLTVSDIIKYHSEQIYSVFAIGFAPGFAFLGEVNPILATPRLATPRKKVAKGSIAIADRQTAVYPAASPGGWNLIGNCPVSLFDAANTPPLPFNIGDSVKFIPIERNEFIRLGGHID
ncbi:MAG: 5-oxoprolinase subunit PxpB [Pseudoalteromonas spongiae]